MLEEGERDHTADSKPRGKRRRQSNHRAGDLWPGQSGPDPQGPWKRDSLVKELSMGFPDAPGGLELSGRWGPDQGAGGRGCMFSPLPRRLLRPRDTH